MKITRTCPVTGVENTMDIDVSVSEIQEWESGMLIQNAAPHLSNDEREFIISGMTADIWDQVFGEEE